MNNIFGADLFHQFYAYTLFLDIAFVVYLKSNRETSELPAVFQNAQNLLQMVVQSMLLNILECETIIQRQHLLSLSQL